MVRSGGPHPLEKLETICCPKAHLKELNQFTAPRMHSYVNQIKSTSYPNSLKCNFKALISNKLLKFHESWSVIFRDRNWNWTDLGVPDQNQTEDYITSIVSKNV